MNIRVRLWYLKYITKEQQTYSITFEPKTFEMNAKYYIAKNRWNGMFSSLLMIYNSTCMSVYSIASFSIIFVSNLFHFYLLLLCKVYSQMFVWKCFRKSLRTHYTSHTHPSKPTNQVGMYLVAHVLRFYFLPFSAVGRTSMV